jgi:hypothetical protein
VATSVLLSWILAPGCGFKPDPVGSVDTSDTEDGSSTGRTTNPVTAGSETGEGSSSSGVDTDPDAGPTVTEGPTISLLEPTRFEVEWRVEPASTGQVEWGQDATYGQLTALAADLQALHRHTVDGLEPNTTYHFRVRGEDELGNAYVGDDVTVTTPADIFEVCEPSRGPSYTPASAADISDPARAGHIAIISSSFDATGATFAEGQTLVPDGGVISGSDIDLASPCIQDDFTQLFDAQVTFTEVYAGSRLSPETFGATGDDDTDDHRSLWTLVMQAAYARSNPSSTYTHNEDAWLLESPLTRAGTFDWDMAGSTIQATDATNLTHIITGTNFGVGGFYHFPFSGFDVVRLYNGTFDGNLEASRFVAMRDVGSFRIANMEVFDLLSPANSYARAVAFRFDLAPSPSGSFTYGELVDNSIHDINAIGDNLSNNTIGVSKAFTFSVTDNGPAEIRIERNEVARILGDDAEGLYTRYDGDARGDMAETTYYVRDNDWLGCSRRAIKFDASNAIIENNYVESLPMFAGDQNGSPKQAALIQAFSIQAGVPVMNIQLRNNEVRVVGDAANSLFATNDSQGVTVEDNTFWAETLDVRKTITFSNPTGQQDALYDGDVSDLVFRNNTLHNTMLNVADKYYVLPGSEPAVIDGNTQTFSGAQDLGAFRGAININGSSLSGAMRGEDEFRISNHTITFDLDTVATGVWNGVISSNGTAPINVVLDNVDITYTGSGSVGAVFGGVRSQSVVNYDGSNAITDCDITGFSGAGAIEFNGADTSVVISNSFGDGNTPLTVQ